MSLYILTQIFVQVNYCKIKTNNNNINKTDLFRLCDHPPKLSACIFLYPKTHAAIFLHNALLCNDTCSVTGGCITYCGGGSSKIRKKGNCFLFLPDNILLSFCEQTAHKFKTRFHAKK